MIRISKIATAVALLLLCAFQGQASTPNEAAPTPEVILWPHRQSETLHVARETVQPFYLMGYARGRSLPEATDMEITAPPGWSVWLGENPPPAVQADETTAQTFPVAFKAHSRANLNYLKGYIPSRATVSSLLVIRAEEGASAGTLKVRWVSDSATIAAYDIALVPVDLPDPRANQRSSTPRFGFWINDPRFHPLTMAAVYQSLARASADYVIITKDMYLRDKSAIDATGLKVYVKQWWKYDGYLPTPPPEEAVSVLKDGNVDRKRWSPTYMAEKGDAFVEGVRKVAKELAQIEGIYGFMLDYEPTAQGIEADYSERSKAAFEKYLGKAVANWPGDVLENGPLCEQWIDFRVSQSDAYVQQFKDQLAEQAPHLKLAVSTSGITGTPADPNRRLAVVDISQLSKITDTIHPQLYSWTSQLPAQSERYLDKLRVGRTTAQASKVPVYTAIGAGVGGSDLPNPALLRTQVLYWWLAGSDGLEVWQYFYGVDGRYLQILSQLSHTFGEAGDWARPHRRMPATTAVAISPAVGIEALLRPVADSSKAVVGFFNFSSHEKSFTVKAQKGWRVDEADRAKTIAPWSVELITVERGE